MISAEANILGGVDKHLRSEVHSDISVNAGSRNAHHLAESLSVICVVLDHETRPTL